MKSMLVTFCVTLGFAAGSALWQTATVETQVGPPRNVAGISKPVRVVSGRISSDVTFTSDHIYVLRGAVFVTAGATLHIQPGTLVAGEAGSVGTLIVERGGRLNAIGTREAPIVFTSDQAPGTRARGDWGGIILNGRAPLNIPGGEGEGEGDTGIYGGDDPDDSSGSMRYVRVEFAGTEFSPDNELNGIAFQGVGRGGSYEYIQVHMNKDDGIEMFGGSVDLKRVVLTNISDDSIDWTFGWNGRLQFAVVSQRGDDADTGIEADNNEFNNELLPRSNPTLYNLTMCGDPDFDEGPESTRGFLLRRGTAGTIRNFIVMGFKTLGMDVNGNSSLNQGTIGALVVSHGVFFLNGPNRNTHFSPNAQALINTGRFSNIVVGQDPGIGNCFDHEAPDWRPRSIATLAGGQLAPAIPPSDGFFEVTTFIGALSHDPEEDWTVGWTAYPQQ
jgi:hypothetical protein